MKWDREEIASFIGTIGVAMLVASGVRYSNQGELLTTSKVLLIAGGVFVLAAIVLGFRAIVRAFSGRSAQQGTNTTILTLAVSPSWPSSISSASATTKLSTSPPKSSTPSPTRPAISSAA